MWNSWVEKAKDLAANIDQQLNESVGADADPRLSVAAQQQQQQQQYQDNPSVTASSSVTINSSSLFPRVAITPIVHNTIIQDGGGMNNDDHNDGGGDDDVWNNDFDFDDGDDHDVINSGRHEGDDDLKEQPAQPEAKMEVAVTPASEPSKNDATPVKTNDDAQPSKVDATILASTETTPLTSVAEHSFKGDASGTSPPPIPPTGPEHDDPDTETPAEAGWEEDHHDDDVDDISLNDEDDPVPTTEMGTAADAAAAQNAPPAPVDIEEVAEAEAAPTPLALPMATDELYGSNVKTDASKTFFSSLVTPATASGNTTARASAGGLLSSLAHRAEGLAHRAEGFAHKAEGGVASLLTAAASHLVDDSHGSRDKTKGETSPQLPPSQVKERPMSSSQVAAAAAGAMSSLFSSTLGGAGGGGGDTGTNASPNIMENDNERNRNKDETVWDEEGNENEWHVEEEADLDISEENEEPSEDPIMVDKTEATPTMTKEEETPNSTDFEAVQASESDSPRQPGPSSTKGPSDTTFVSVTVSEESVPSSSPPSTPPLPPQEEDNTDLKVPSEDDSASPIPKALSTPTVPIRIEDDPRYQQLEQLLRLREDQLANKAEQLNQLQELMETQENEYKQKLHETKEEAKKRIMRAKERCDAAEAKLLIKSSTGSDEIAKLEGVIHELREEGQALAMKQATMEQAVRAAKGETRDLLERLDGETTKKVQALDKVAKLEAEVKATKEALAAARKGESQASKLENDLLAARSDAEMKGNTILSLQQQIKELTAESKDLQIEIEKTRKSAAHIAQQEKTSMRREQQDLLADLENKLRTTEREAGVREDALRHEVEELRKRWQDAVRRADALSMDIQSSTAPLLRQLESMERQNRVRAANWAELENRLRSELEEAVIQNETLSKDRSEFKSNYTRLERSLKEREDDLAVARAAVEEQTTKITKLEAQVAKLESEATKRQEEYERVERLASEGVARVRSEMTQTVVDSEERYRSHIDKLESELKVEREKRSQLERQVDQLLENSGMMVSHQAPASIRRESKPKKLRQTEGQADILAGALGLDDTDDEDDGDDDEGDDSDIRSDRGGISGGDLDRRGSTQSYAAMEQLSSNLKAAQSEVGSLRKSLRESEMIRNSLVEELAETRQAKEKLPLFEAKVRELTAENREQALEIRGLRDDVAEVRELYRTQLNVLLEEKALNASDAAKSGANGTNGNDPPVPQPQDDDDAW